MNITIIIIMNILTSIIARTAEIVHWYSGCSVSSLVLVLKTDSIASFEDPILKAFYYCWYCKNYSVTV